MNISCTITLASDDVQVDPTQMAEKILMALGGDPGKDHCYVTVSATPESGTHGTMPLPSPPPEVAAA